MGTLRFSDAAGAALDRGLVGDDAYYVRLSNIFRTDLGMRFASSELAASYTLRLVPDPASLSVAPYHTADLRYAYISPRFVLTLSQSAGIGEQVFLGGGRVTPQAATGSDTSTSTTPLTMPTLATAGALDTNVLPASTTLTLMSARSNVAVGYRFERRLSGLLSAGYQQYGGLGEARSYLPLQRSVDGVVAVDYMLSPRVNLVSGLVGARYWVTGNQQYLLFTLSESLLYTWTPTTKLDAGAGLSSRVSEASDGSSTLTFSPVAALGVSHTLGGRDLMGIVRLSATYAPWVDSVTGRIQNRVSVTGSATASKGDARAGVSVGTYLSIPTSDPGALAAVSGTIFGGYQLNDWLGVSLSAQAAQQRVKASPDLPVTRTAPSGFTWGLYAGLYAVSPNFQF